MIQSLSRSISPALKVAGRSMLQVDVYKRQYTTYTTKLGRKRVRMYQYDYRTEDGELFSCCAPTLEAVSYTHLENHAKRLLTQG